MTMSFPTVGLTTAGVTDHALIGRMTMGQTKKTNPLDIQVGGGHYKDYVIQPFEYAQRNGLPFGEGCIVKYVSRHRTKNGIEDLRKAKHFLELIAWLAYGEEL